MFFDDTDNIYLIYELVFRISMPGDELYALLEAKSIDWSNHDSNMDKNPLLLTKNICLYGLMSLKTFILPQK